jgi:hypothetical protein
MAKISSVCRSSLLSLYNAYIMESALFECPQSTPCFLQLDSEFLYDNHAFCRYLQVTIFFCVNVDFRGVLPDFGKKACLSV